jgi:hypothetical protein
MCNDSGIQVSLKIRWTKHFSQGGSPPRYLLPDTTVWSSQNRIFVIPIGYEQTLRKPQENGLVMYEETSILSSILNVYYYRDARLRYDHLLFFPPMILDKLLDTSVYIRSPLLEPLIIQFFDELR